MIASTRTATAVLALALLAASDLRADGKLPGSLVYLADIDPSIRQEMRYATARNFTGKPVPGYEAGECILKRDAAAALARVQKDLAAKGLSLKVYDCYRPVRAVQAFMAWAEGRGGGAAAYYPNVARRALVAQGYIAARSGHSTGSAIDLTVVAAAPPPAPPASDPAPAGEIGSCTAPAAQREPDDTLDMGTGYDCFDPKSHTRTSRITDAQRSARETLLAAMGRQGFSNYAKEWWHFSFGGGGTAYDVPIKGRTGNGKQGAPAPSPSEPAVSPAAAPTTP